ncbi:MAG TPA: hypothetical protein K8V56_13230 [Sporosarcina psychrophila]|uniref:Uncharacterized protein n=1 Tax=Sporosarcina psychrophila TaxID=1476 RepID=A0A921FZU8_SPOPS|nr:hypothetical protein [Sporosarcina psychrophila]
MNPLAQARKRGRRSRKTGCEALIQAYRSGYHEVAPSLDGLFEKMYFIIYDELLNPVYKLSEGALTGVAEVIRLAAKLLGLWREASPSAVAVQWNSLIQHIY